MIFDLVIGFVVPRAIFLCVLSRERDARWFVGRADKSTDEQCRANCEYGTPYDEGYCWALLLVRASDYDETDGCNQDSKDSHDSLPYLLIVKVIYIIE